MKQEKTQETGRTMLETIAVIILVGLLVISSIAGFRFVVKNGVNVKQLTKSALLLLACVQGILLKDMKMETQSLLK